MKTNKKTTTAGFEPARGDPSRFQIYRYRPLSHIVLMMYSNQLYTSAFILGKPVE